MADTGDCNSSEKIALLVLSKKEKGHTPLTFERDNKLTKSRIIIWITIVGCALHFPSSPRKRSSTLVTATDF